MRITTTLAAAATGFILTAGTALAWGDAYTGDGTHNPNSGPVYAYPTTHNYCPAGLRPVVMGGVVCCGTPTAAGYGDYSPVKHRKVNRVHQPKAVHKVRRHVPQSYAVEGVKGVAMN